VVDINECVRPQAFLQFFSGHHLTWVLQQDGEDLKRLTGQLQLYPALTQFTCSKINFESPEAHGTRGLDSLSHRVSPQVSPV